MALRESSHAHRGRLGVYTKKEEKIRTYPKKKNKSKKKRGSGFVAPRFTGEKRERERERPFEKLWLNGYPPHPKKSNKNKSKKIQKNQSKKNKKSEIVSVKTISRTSIPSERINQKEKRQKS